MIGRLLVVGMLLCLPEPVLATGLDGWEVAQLQEAIDRGISYLAATQLETGAFPIYGSEDPTILSGGILRYCPLFTTFALHALRAVDHPQVEELTRRGLDYLLTEMEPPGVWRFYGKQDPWHLDTGPDLDDIALASAALMMNGRAIPDNLGQILPFRAPQGAFYTWQDPASVSERIRGWINDLKVPRGVPTDELNDVDCALNINVLFYLGLQDRQDPQACAYVNERFAQRDVPRCSLYYPNGAYVSYMAVRAFLHGATCLGPSVEVIRDWLPELQHEDGSWGDDLATANAVTSLLQLGGRGDSIERGVARLSNRQLSDGSWPRSRYVEANHRSEAVTTAFVVEAFATYLNGAQQAR